MHKEDDVLSATHSAAAAAAPGQPMTVAAHTDYTSEELRDAVLSILDDNKADDVVQVDLRGKTSVCDFMVIASGRSSRQVAAMSEKLSEELKARFSIFAKMEGKDTGDWVLLDAGDVVVHLFRPEVREFYQLEKMWMPAQATA
ncbi:ribosome silencing factor [Sagittula salina]|uniref:Ribosomal silencing factor RsfS n=1 Tax=Sagittula salina TaxID=2820268 RepID=A0A940MSM3_9RHOB|nr:ribosome silencing factor [Sagittula salina]MBP0482249.1 ribosome silencing factor [Sagittula salina]